MRKVLTSPVFYLRGKRTDDGPMKDANCRTLIAEAGGLLSDFGSRIGMTNDNGQLSNTFGLKPRKNIGDPLAERIESAFGRRADRKQEKLNF